MSCETRVGKAKSRATVVAGAEAIAKVTAVTPPSATDTDAGVQAEAEAEALSGAEAGQAAIGAGEGPLFVCTSLDTEDEVKERYGTEAVGHVLRLKELGAVVAHGVDAMALQASTVGL
jgi:hypothetical protein